MLNKWVKEEWCKVLDDDFVEGVLFKAIEDHLGKATDLMKRLAKVVFGSESSETTSVKKPKKKKFTVPQPFDLHKPKEPVVPEPIRIESRVLAQEVPESTYNNSLEKINARNQARRQKIREEVEKKHGGCKSFDFAENKANVEAMREAKLKAEVAELQYQFKAKPAPKFSATAKVRTNAALILRENKLIRDKQEKEAAVIKAYETELRDASEFYNWQTKARKGDEESRLQLVDERREDMKASNRRAREAMDDQEQSNADAASRQRTDMEVAREKREAELAAGLEVRRAQADAVRAVQFEAPKKAADKVHKERQERAAKQMKEMAALRREREEKDQIEQEIRNDLIRQIRALERAPKNAFFVRDFDPTQTSGHRLDCEMSLVELRERLKMNKQRALEEEQRKREKLRQEKVKKQQQLDAALSRAMKVHKMAEEQNKERKRLSKMGAGQRKAEMKAKSAAQTRAVVARLRSRRAKKKEEVENARIKNAKIAKARLLLGADKDAMERRHMQEQLLGAEREARDRQTRAKREVAGYERIKVRHSKQKATYKKKVDREAHELDARRADQVRKAHKYITDKEFREKRGKQQHFREHQAKVSKDRATKHDRAYKPKQYLRPTR